MEVVMIEKETLEVLRQRLENFVSRMDALCAPFCKTAENLLGKISAICEFEKPYASGIAGLHYIALCVAI